MWFAVFHIFFLPLCIHKVIPVCLATDNMFVPLHPSGTNILSLSSSPSSSSSLSPSGCGIFLCWQRLWGIPHTVITLLALSGLSLISRYWRYCVPHQLNHNFNPFAGHPRCYGWDMGACTRDYQWTANICTRKGSLEFDKKKTTSKISTTHFQDVWMMLRWGGWLKAKGKVRCISMSERQQICLQNKSFTLLPIGV